MTASSSGCIAAALLYVGAVGLFPALMATASRHIHFATDDGFDVALARFVKKVCCGKKIAMIGDGHRRHFLAGSFVKQFAGFASPIQRRETGRNVRGNKLRLTHGPRFKISARIIAKGIVKNSAATKFFLSG